MEGTYPVLQGGQAIGSVSMARQGLYYHIRCRCRISGEVMFRLILTHQDGQLDLGILTPMDGCFGLNSSISAKKLGKGNVTFSLRPRHPLVEEKCFPVSAEEPFAYLQKLERAYLIRRREGSFIALKEEK